MLGDAEVLEKAPFLRQSPAALLRAAARSSRGGAGPARRGAGSASSAMLRPARVHAVLATISNGGVPRLATLSSTEAAEVAVEFA